MEACILRWRYDRSPREKLMSPINSKNGGVVVFMGWAWGRSLSPYRRREA
jgi:hypothetical protein